MKSGFLITFLLLTTFESMAGELKGSIGDFIGAKPSASLYEIDGEYLYSRNVLPMFYLNRKFLPAWIIRDTPSWISRDAPVWTKQSTPQWLYQDVPAWEVRNVVGKNGYDLVDYIRQTDQHGLHPTDFHLNLIVSYIGKMVSWKPMEPQELMKLDVLLTDAFMLLGAQLYYGKVDPAREGGDWKMELKDPELRLDLKLEEALAAGTVPGSLDLLGPRYQAYWMMKNQLAFFLGLNEQSWPVLSSASIIRPGDSNLVIPKIRERLMKLRYPLSDSVSVVYDAELKKQLMVFQNDWGLNSDSLIGKGTLGVLNSKPEKLINKLKVNMERFRWLPLQVTRKYIIVNIANFALDLIEETDTLISMRVIVGKDYRETPVFNERMTYIVFSPTWTVPPTILRTEVIPALLKGPGYLKRKHMKILRPDGSEIAYSKINWSQISAKRFPYMVRQDPGSFNSLGRVKFMFPNVYNVYIHDTPSKGAFADNDRALSSGCIRAEKPYDLAVLLLSDMPEWSPDDIQKAMAQTREQKVILKTPVDVVLVYLTAWTDGNRRVQFRKDVYDRDENVLKELNKNPGSANASFVPL